MKLRREEKIRRIKAARMLAGLSSAEALADRINARGMSRQTIKKIESGARDVAPHELEAIATACELPLGFFTRSRADAFGGTATREDAVAGRLPDLRDEVARVLLPELEDRVTRNVLKNLGVLERES